MNQLLKTLLILAIATSAMAQTWPSGAMLDPIVGTRPPAEGQYSISALMTNLSNDHWKDSRQMYRIGFGLGRGLGLTAATSTRDLSGFGAFQQGVEDTRLGLAIWPLSYREKLHFGLNSNLILPTGYRTQELFYDSLAQTMNELPAFTLDQTAGEILPAVTWSPGKAASMSAFAGVFSTSDRVEQAFRWGLGMRLNPFSEKITAEFGYAQSVTQQGSFPDTEILTAGLNVDLKWGVSVTPGFWAELESDPMVGMSIGLTIQNALPKNIFPPKASPRQPAHRAGAVLVAPPLSDLPLAGADELWRQIREELRTSFDEVIPLESLDRPGLPYDDSERDGFWSSINAIAAANPNARWILITRVEREEVNRIAGLSIPLMVTQPTWQAECLMRFELVDLFALRSFGEQIVEAKAVRKEGLRIPLLSSVEEDVLSLDNSRALTYEAYRNAGREMAILLPGADR